jgi:non-ribosomal peptide synthetase component F
LLACLYAHLHGLTRQQDLAVASLVANRARPEVAETVGFFVNMVVLRTAVAPGEPFRRLLRATRKTVSDALAHQGLPFQMLPPHAVRSEREGRVVRADDLVVQFVEGTGDETAFAELETEPLDLDFGRDGDALFPLELVLGQRDDLLQAHLLFRDDACSPGWARQFLSSYARLVERAAADPDASVAALCGDTN